MDQQSIEAAVCLEEYKKCGYLYRSPTIKDKQSIILSCLYCSETSLKLDDFLLHLDYVHPTENSSCDLFNEEISELSKITSSKICIANNSLLVEHVKMCYHE